MSAVRARFITAFTAVALAVVLAACGQQKEHAAAPPAELAANGPVTSEGKASATAPTPEPTCFVKTDDNPAWRPASAGNRQAMCFIEDACNGGIGTRPGVCTKWAISADAPPLAWSVALTNPQPQNDIPPPPDKGREDTSCVESSCAPQLLLKPTPIRELTNREAALVATIPAYECVQPGITRNIPNLPLRGVVLDAYGPFAAGDVIYVDGYGEGDYTIWWRGDWHSGIYDPLNMAVRWDRLKDNPEAGLWVEYTRASGERGWALDPHIAEAPCSMAKRGAP